MMLIRSANLWCLGCEGIVYHQVMEAVDVGVDGSDLTALEECVSDSQGSKGILLWRGRREGFVQACVAALEVPPMQ